MRIFFILLISSLTIMESFSQNKSADRQPVAAGSFYEADKESLTSDITKLFSNCKKAPGNWNVRAIICPHAGYVFSGKIAASSLSSIPRNAAIENIFLIGSSHRMAFDGASVYYSGDFITPLGKAIVNKEIANKIRGSNKVFDFPVTAHIQEHSLEVQVPLIQYYFTKTPMIVPIIIGTNNSNTIKTIAQVLKPWFTPGNLFLISSDFSHYPSYKDAVYVDNQTAEGIISDDPRQFLATLSKNESLNMGGLLTSMCGWTSGLTLLYMVEGDKNLEFKKIDYCNSGDTPYGDKSQVVGYNAIALVEKNTSGNAGQGLTSEVKFSQKEKDLLFEIARNSIRTMLYEDKKISLDAQKMPDVLKKNLGAFVTLKINGQLRGCIGRFISSDPLYEVVRASALSSAFEDTRFLPLTKPDYEKTDIEITVIGPMTKINNINEIVLGKHGIYIKKDFRAGTMLPQVAIEQGWTVEQFLGYTSRDKAGLGWDGWKNADIYIYEGIVLEETKK